MTLVVSFGNNERVIQLSDRKLYSANGIYTALTKTIAYQCDNAVMLVGFCGLAKVGRFNLRDWLMNELALCSEPESNLGRVTDRLCESLTKLFSEDRKISSLNRSLKRTSIVFTGYISAVNPPALACRKITNFEFKNGEFRDRAAPVFSAFDWGERSDVKRKKNPIFLECTGNVTNLERNHFKPIIEMLGRKNSDDSIIEMAVKLFREFTELDGKSDQIGRDITVTIIHRNDLGNVSGGHYTENIYKKEYLMADWIVTSGGNTLMVKDMKVNLKPKS